MSKTLQEKFIEEKGEKEMKFKITLYDINNKMLGEFDSFKEAEESKLKWNRLTGRKKQREKYKL